MKRSISYLLLTCLLLTTSGIGAAIPATAQDDQLRFVVVSQGQASDPF